MKKQTKITNNSIDSAGLPKDYRQAFAEYIWNSFDAKATQVNISYKSNSLGFIDEISIEDDGEGIDHKTLTYSFGNFLDSLKRKTIKRSSYVRGRKGKGRFSFSLFATKAVWHTCYQDTEGFYSYEIHINHDQKESYEEHNFKLAQAGETGTKVVFQGIFGLTDSFFHSADFKDFLASEFGWFLWLNRSKKHRIVINGEVCNFKHLILENEQLNWIISDEEDNAYKFKINYIQWSENIGDRYYCYYINSRHNEFGKLLTSFNNNALNFHHSVYIESDFFDILEAETIIETDNNLFNHMGMHVIFRKLQQDLKSLLEGKQKKFIQQKAASQYLLQIEQRGSLSTLNALIDSTSKDKFAELVTGLYCIEPRLFTGLKPIQEKTLLMLLFLSTQTQDNSLVQQLISTVLNLNEDEQSSLSHLLHSS